VRVLPLGKTLTKKLSLFFDKGRKGFPWFPATCSQFPPSQEFYGQPATLFRKQEDAWVFLCEVSFVERISFNEKNF